MEFIENLENIIPNKTTGLKLQFLRQSLFVLNNN